MLVSLPTKILLLFMEILLTFDFVLLQVKVHGVKVHGVEDWPEDISGKILIIS